MNKPEDLLPLIEKTDIALTKDKQHAICELSDLLVLCDLYHTKQLELTKNSKPKSVSKITINIEGEGGVFKGLEKIDSELLEPFEAAMENMFNQMDKKIAGISPKLKKWLDDHRL